MPWLSPAQLLKDQVLLFLKVRTAPQRAAMLRNAA
jgi:hypothetical protein